MAKKTKQSSADQKLLDEAQKRFKRCEDFEGEARNLWREDLRFANADPENGWQWDEAMRKSRELDKRPCLTINKTKQHNRQITNDARQNKPSVRVYPVDGGADKKTAEILNGIIRHIESNSDAETAYDTAAEFAVDAGLGYWRVVTDYASPDSFDQEIFVRRVKNPLNVYLDPDIQEADGSDARFGFFFRDMPKDEFEAQYPDAEPITWPMESGGGSEWLRKDMIRVAEYFRRTEAADTLYADENGNTIRASEMSPEMLEAAKNANLRSRPVKTPKVEWLLIAGGQQILDRKDWPGQYIPIVRVVGDEVEVDGKIDRKGHTRALKDAQRMYNYWTSSAVEHVALQTKVPWVTPAEAIEGYERYWDNANTTNLPYLPYNSVDENGNQIPSPQRPQPPVMAQAYMNGMQVAAEEMKMASGQYDASMGAKSNETSGRAIMVRQREGDTATFHFIDNVARAIKYTGNILVDLIPKIYDTARVIRILGEDGKESMVKIDPSQQQAYLKRQNELTREIEEIYNPSVGRYDVVVAVGPSYTTRRQEAFQALTEMSSRSPQLLQQAGDLIMRSADFPMAEELAERLAKFLPPEAQDENEDIPPAAKAQIDQLTGLVKQLDDAVQKMSAELEDKDLKRDEVQIKAFEAETERLKAMGGVMTPEQVQALVVQTVAQALQVALPDVQAARTVAPMQAPPPQEPMDQTEPPPGGFFTPEQGTADQQ